MKICLVSKFFNPDDVRESTRLRRMLALALSGLGHEVHVITQDKQQITREYRGVRVHSIPDSLPAQNISGFSPELDALLSYSLAVNELIRSLGQNLAFDVIDAPLSDFEGIAGQIAKGMPIVIWINKVRGQIIDRDKKTPNRLQRILRRLEKESLSKAAGVTALTQNVLQSSGEIFNFKSIPALQRVIPPGLPDIDLHISPHALPGGVVELIVIGRVKREEIKRDLDLIAKLLVEEHRLFVRYVSLPANGLSGLDSQSPTLSSEYFTNRYPRFTDRFLFQRIESKTQLEEAFRSADTMLIPFHYEGSGINYVDAMRAALPVVSFSGKTALEFLPEGDESGGILVSRGDEKSLIESVRKLVNDTRYRLLLGKRGRQRFITNYQDSIIARSIVDFYNDVLESKAGLIPSRKRKIYQVMEAMDVGDAVSSITIENFNILRSMNVGGSILSLYCHPELAENVRPVQKFDINSHAALIFHYWNYSKLERLLDKFHGPKAIYFHNITPPEYFPRGSEAHESTSRGYEQLDNIADLFDLIIGVSNFDLFEFSEFMTSPKPSIRVPPILNPEEVRSRSFDGDLYRGLRCKDTMNVLFVGRIAPNKRQDQLMCLFDYYYRKISSAARLYLVGNDKSSPEYRMELEELRLGLTAREHIVFTGKVTDEELFAYYHAADVFVCASEHEGFCLPLIEAMAFGIPVLAFDAAAVPETLGNSGVLFNKWDLPSIAEHITLLQNDPAYHSSVIAGQMDNLKRFSREEALSRLSAISEFLLDGKHNPLISYLKPS